MLFLVNPQQKRGGRVARRKKVKRRKLTAAQIRAGFGGKRRKAALKNKRKKRRTTTVRRKKRRTTAPRTHSKRRVSTVARRKRTSHRATRRRRRTGGTVRRHRRYRRNPGFSVRGIGNQLMTGAKRAATVVVGKAAGKFAANVIPVPKTTMVGQVGSQLLAALAIGVVGRKFIGHGLGEDLFIGAMTAPMETALKMVPVVGPLLGEDPFLPMGAYDPFLPMGAYAPPEAPAATVGSYEDVGDDGFGY